MLRSDSIFGRRESTPPAPAPAAAPAQSSPALAPTPIPGTTAAVSQSAHGSSATATASATTPAPSAVKPVAQSEAVSETGSKLIVGPNIKLKGVEITDCDTLVVEGRVEATIRSRAIQIAENGSFKGSAEFEIAEIRGEFDGDLTVRQKLVIYATGKVSGKIRYGKIVIEEGGQFSGDVLATTGAEAPTLTLARTAPGSVLAS